MRSGLYCCPLEFQRIGSSLIWSLTQQLTLSSPSTMLATVRSGAESNHSTPNRDLDHPSYARDFENGPYRSGVTVLSVARAGLKGARRTTSSYLGFAMNRRCSDAT